GIPVQTSQSLTSTADIFSPSRTYTCFIMATVMAMWASSPTGFSLCQERLIAAVFKIEDIVTHIQDETEGTDIVQWLMKNLSIEDPGKPCTSGVSSQLRGTSSQSQTTSSPSKTTALSIAFSFDSPLVFKTLIHVTINIFVILFSHQAPYFWPSNCWEPENTDYAIYLCKRTMQNKTRLELADYEAENLARLQRAFARKWEFIYMQAEAQVKIDRKKDKTERKILDSQERAFWDVHRPVHKRTLTSVLSSSQILFLNSQLDRHRMKMSKVAESLISYTEQYMEYDPFVTAPEPSNPWTSDDPSLWDLEASKEPSQQRVKKWGFSLEEALKDPAGQELFLKFLESEFSSENLRFWLAVQDLKRMPQQDVSQRAQDIWAEFLAEGAPSSINLDSHSYERTSQNLKDPGRYSYEDAQDHIYKLMKSDSYARFLRSNVYQDLLMARKK
ncbi:Regulator of G-protein signaling 6, partial [Nibea albiflora]